MEKGMRFMLNESNAFVQYEQQKGERGSLIELIHATAFDGMSSAAYVSTEDGDTVAQKDAGSTRVLFLPMQLMLVGSLEKPAGSRL
jgi:hypothetical protein